MTNNLWKIVLLSTILCLGANFTFAKELTRPIAEKGTIDLRQWDFSTDGNIRLNGEWEFYWNKFITTDSLSSGKNESFINVPNIWNNHHELEANQSTLGFASYRLNIKLNTNERLAIKYLNSATSCEIFIDGVSYFKSGHPGKSKEETTPSYKPAIIRFIPKNENVELILQIANFHHKKGGQWEPLIIGKEQKVEQFAGTRLFIELMLIGCAFFMFVYHIVIYKKRNNDRSTLYFALFNLLIALRLSVTGEFPIYMLGDFNWELLVQIDYISFYLSTGFMLLLMKKLFPNEIKNIHAITIVITALLFTLIVLFLPTRLFTYSILYFQAFTILYALYGFYILYKSIKNRREGAKQFFTGFIVLFICLVHDVLNENSVIHSFAITPIGVAAFIVSQASILSLRIRNALISNENLSQELQLQNNEFHILNERYKKQNAQLIIAKEKAEQSDQFKSAFLANMSHEIRTPMNGILGFTELLAHDDFSEKEREEFISIINERSHQLLGIVNDIIDISKIETGQFDTNYSACDINTLVDELYRTYEHEAKRKNINLKKYQGIGSKKNIIYTDSIKLRQIMDNLISNAIKFTSYGGVEFGYESEKDKLTFYIKDTGIGISKEEKEIIFDRFNQANGKIAQKYGGTGLGLAIAKAYIEKLGGELWLESKKDEGSIFFFTLPYAATNSSN